MIFCVHMSISNVKVDIKYRFVAELRKNHAVKCIISTRLKETTDFYKKKL